jgi:hypothetical protein
LMSAMAWSGAVFRTAAFMGFSVVGAWQVARNKAVGWAGSVG